MHKHLVGVWIYGSRHVGLLPPLVINSRCTQSTLSNKILHLGSLPMPATTLCVPYQKKDLPQNAQNITFQNLVDKKYNKKAHHIRICYVNVLVMMSWLIWEISRIKIFSVDLIGSNCSCEKKETLCPQHDFRVVSPLAKKGSLCPKKA